jgi:hypothetical protein
VGDATKIVHLYSNMQSIIPKVEVAGSIPVSRSSFQYQISHTNRQFSASV